MARNPAPRRRTLKWSSVPTSPVTTRWRRPGGYVAEDLAEDAGGTQDPARLRRERFNARLYHCENGAGRSVTVLYKPFA